MEKIKENSLFLLKLNIELSIVQTLNLLIHCPVTLILGSILGAEEERPETIPQSKELSGKDRSVSRCILMPLVGWCKPGVCGDLKKRVTYSLPEKSRKSSQREGIWTGF